VGHLLRPFEFAAHLASELLYLNLGATPWDLQ
jgi:hypothetical protein